MKTNVQKARMECLRCGHKWFPRQEEVRQCPKCRTMWFDKPKEDKK